MDTIYLIWSDKTSSYGTEVLVMEEGFFSSLEDAEARLEELNAPYRALYESYVKAGAEAREKYLERVRASGEFSAPASEYKPISFEQFRANRQGAAMTSTRWFLARPLAKHA